MTSVIVQVVDSLIGHQVAVYEEESIQTKAVGEFEPLCGVPFILCIDASLVEGYPCSWFCLTTVSIGKAHHFGSGSVDEVIHTAVSVIACTVAHVLVVGHLVLIGHSASNLVTSHRVDEFVLDIEDVVMYSIVVGKQFVTQ